MYPQIRCRINTKTSHTRHLTNAVSPFVRLVLEGYASSCANLYAPTSCCRWEFHVSAFSASRIDNQRTPGIVSRSSRASHDTRCTSTVYTRSVTTCATVLGGAISVIVLLASRGINTNRRFAVCELMGSASGWRHEV